MKQPCPARGRSSESRLHQTWVSVSVDELDPDRDASTRLLPPRPKTELLSSSSSILTVTLPRFTSGNHGGKGGDAPPHQPVLTPAVLHHDSGSDTFNRAACMQGHPTSVCRRRERRMLQQPHAYGRGVWLGCQLGLQQLSITFFNRPFDSSLESRPRCVISPQRPQQRCTAPCVCVHRAPVCHISCFAWRL
ncbi:unnamed protein product [Pleuronectes platessa]|uniref:Uncharacterized protein n=1 Tax=Pleuronectes platessa TaxID=8262 RepID=A0A9N7UD69_PLEPL|nr:unnamed protein product [Pleuronectes platessa]